jgi:hypothetical protein
MPSSSPLASLTVAQLQAELNRRRAGLPRLHKKRARLVAELARIDEQIAALSGAAARAPGRRTSRARSSAGATRARNSMTLVEALQKVLDGKSLRVNDAIDAVRKIGYISDSPSFRVIVNQALLNKKLFKRVSRGVYTKA